MLELVLNTRNELYRGKSRPVRLQDPSMRSMLDPNKPKQPVYGHVFDRRADFLSGYKIQAIYGEPIDWDVDDFGVGCNNGYKVGILAQRSFNNVTMNQFTVIIAILHIHTTANFITDLRVRAFLGC